MRTGSVVGAIAGLSLVAFQAPATAGARGCGPAGAKTLSADGAARIYQTGESVYGCAESSGRSYLLAADQSRPGQPHIGRVALAGVVAAYGETTSGVDTISAQVIVRRLDNGRTLHNAAATTRPPGPEYFESIYAVVVKADGAVAWIAHAGSILQKEAGTEVDRIDRRGEARLDSTAAGDITGLMLRGSRLSWRHGRASKTATLL